MVVDWPPPKLLESEEVGLFDVSEITNVSAPLDELLEVDVSIDEALETISPF
jgi:hypothetical protein